MVAVDLGGADRMVLRVYVLGRFAVEVAGQPVASSGWRLRKASDVIKLLALAPGHRLHREQLVDLLWPHLSLNAGVNNMHQALHVARRIINVEGQPSFLSLVDGTVRLCPAGDLIVDAVEFEARAGRAQASGDLAAMSLAVQLYSGQLLPDDLYQDWTVRRRAELEQLCTGLLLDIGRGHLAVGEPAPAIAALRAVLSRDVCDEAAHRELMRAYALDGQRAAALRQYQELVGVLDRELGVAPERETEHLHATLLAGRLGGEATAARETSAVVPLPRAGSEVEQPGPLGCPIPLQLSTFVGRQTELGVVTDLMVAARLVTLTGAGGCGKTRLATAAAERAATAFSDGVWLADLGPLSDPVAVARAVAAAVGAIEPAGLDVTAALARHLRTRSVLLVLDNCEHLLGACGRLLDGLLRVCGGLRVLATSRQPLGVYGEVVWRVPPLPLPDAGLAVAARQLSDYDATRLFVDRARERLPGWAPTDDEAAQVAVVCRRLDGLPLAIELAAARLSVLAVAEIANRLDDRFGLLAAHRQGGLSRQQTLKATLDWSHDLLTVPERALFRWLAVFAGTFDLPAVEAICAELNIDRDSLELVSGLVDKSMVTAVAGPGSVRRYRLLETMRAYASDQLHKDDQAKAVRAAHARWFVDLVERAAPELGGPRRRAWLQRLELDFDNVRAVFAWLITAEPRTAQRLVGQLWPFWSWRGNLAEGDQAVADALAADPTPSRERFQALVGRWLFCVRMGRHELAATAVRSALDIAEHLGEDALRSDALVIMASPMILDDAAAARNRITEARDLAVVANDPARTATAVHSLAVLAWATGDLDGATTLLMQSLSIVEESSDGPQSLRLLALGMMAHAVLGDPSSRVLFEETYIPTFEASVRAAAGYIRANLGSLARVAGDASRAEQHFAEALAIFQAQRDEYGIATILARLANLAAARGDVAVARQTMRRSLLLRQRMEDHRGVGLCLTSLGHIETLGGDHAAARSLLNQTRAVFGAANDRPALAQALANLAALHVAEGDLTRARSILAEAIGVLRSVNHPTRIAYAMVDLAEIELSRGEAEAAAVLAAEAIAIFTTVGSATGMSRCRGLSQRATAKRSGSKAC